MPISVRPDSLNAEEPANQPRRGPANLYSFFLMFQQFSVKQRNQLQSCFCYEFRIHYNKLAFCFCQRFMQFLVPS